MANTDIDTQESAPALHRGQPTLRMIEAATRAAQRHGIELPERCLRDFEACKAFLDAWLSRPTQKAVEYAMKISMETGVALPSTVLANARDLSLWIEDRQRGM